MSSMRERMFNSAAKGLAEDAVDDLKILSERSKMPNEGYIINTNDHLPYITCYMCGSDDCHEIKFGNKRNSSIHVMDLCKDCQRKMAEFLLNNQ